MSKVPSILHFNTEIQKATVVWYSLLLFLYHPGLYRRYLVLLSAVVSCSFLPARIFIDRPPIYRIYRAAKSYTSVAGFARKRVVLQQFVHYAILKSILGFHQRINQSCLESKGRRKFSGDY